MTILERLLAGLLLAFLSQHLVLGQANQGVLQGVVRDAETEDPLPGATVVIDTLKTGAQTDSSGRFAIRGIPTGSYAVRATYPGYQARTQYNIRIENRVVQLNFKLRPASTETIEVEASLFQRGNMELVSTREIGLEQIRSNPGGNQDPSRLVQTLPGVSGAAGFRNDIIVRGGAPNENVFYLDGIEIPNINHFSTQGSGGGPVGIINSNFIEKVTFQASGFAPRYDDALSSVLAFDMKEGNTERFQTRLTLGASEAGVTFDTPLTKDGSVTLIASARRSYLQFLFELLELPFLPDYWDYQYKLNWRIDKKNELTVLGIGAIDRFEKNTPEDTDPEQRFVLDGLPIFEQNTYTVGLRWKHLTQSGYLSVAASRNALTNNQFLDRQDSQGNVFRPFDFEATEAETKLRVNRVQKLGQWTLGYGGLVQHAAYENREVNIEEAPSGIGLDTVRAAADIDFLRYGFHAKLGRRFGRLRTGFGMRTDLNTFTSEGQQPLTTLSPRLNLSYALTDRWALNASSGVYYKLPPYTLLGFRNKGRFQNRDAEYIRSTHVVLGTEYQPKRSLNITLEGFFKWYDNYPASLRDSVSLANLGGDFGVFGNQNTQSVGKGRAYGLEVAAQQQLTDQLYGTFAYTLYRSEFTAFDAGDFTRSSWDNRHLISFVGGYRFGAERTWELSAKWRFLGGRPYTPYDIEQSVAIYPVTGLGVRDFERLNEAETRVFSQLDLRLDKRWFYDNWTLNIFLDIQNATATNNLQPPDFTLQRTADGSAFARDADGDFIPTLVQLDQNNVVPSIGIRVTF